MILDGFALATEGQIAPTIGGRCLAPFTLASGGVIVVEVDQAAKLADPWAGPNRFIEPFDRGYYHWKYGPPKVSQPAEAGQIESPSRDLEGYVDELHRGLALGYAEIMVRALELDQAAQRAMIDQLEQNLDDARAAVLAAQQKQQLNNQAAIAAVLEYYY